MSLIFTFTHPWIEPCGKSYTLGVCEPVMWEVMHPWCEPCGKSCTLGVSQPCGKSYTLGVSHVGSHTPLVWAMWEVIHPWCEPAMWEFIQFSCETLILIYQFANQILSQIFIKRIIEYIHYCVWYKCSMYLDEMFCSNSHTLFFNSLEQFTPF